MISFNKKVSVVGAALVVCATLVGASVASAQGTGATKSLRSLGGPTRFTAPVRSVDALKRSMARRGIQRDIATILTKAGNPSVTAEVQRILAEGQVMASTLAPGTTISASIANEFTEAVGDLYTSSLIFLGLILFLITFTVLACARLLLSRLDKIGRAHV